MINCDATPSGVKLVKGLKYITIVLYIYWTSKFIIMKLNLKVHKSNHLSYIWYSLIIDVLDKISQCQGMINCDPTHSVSN